MEIGVPFNQTFIMDMLAVQVETGSAKIKLDGEIDLSNNKMLFEAFNKMLKKRPALVQIDIRSLTYLDSAGISAIVWFANKLKEHDGFVELITLESPMYKILKMVGIDKIGNIKIVR